MTKKEREAVRIAVEALKDVEIYVRNQREVMLSLNLKDIPKGLQFYGLDDADDLMLARGKLEKLLP